MFAHIKELYAYRELLVAFTTRRIITRYKQSVMGIGWAVVQPVAMMVVFTVIFKRFINLSSEGLPYPVFNYCALLPWTLFATSMTTGSASLVEHAHIIRKVYFPREVLPLSSIAAALVDFAIATVVFIGLMAYYGIWPSAYALFVPVLLILQLAFTYGLVIFFAAVNVYYRDVVHAMRFLVQMWMYATPIVYSMDVVPEHLRLAYVALNPMAGLIDGYRAVVLHGRPPELTHLVIVAVMTVAVFAATHLAFRRMEPAFADVI